MESSKLGTPMPNRGIYQPWNEDADLLHTRQMTFHLSCSSCSNFKRVFLEFPQRISGSGSGGGLAVALATSIRCQRMSYWHSKLRPIKLSVPVISGWVINVKNRNMIMKLSKEMRVREKLVGGGKTPSSRRCEWDGNWEPSSDGWRFRFAWVYPTVLDWMEFVDPTVA